MCQQVQILTSDFSPMETKQVVQWWDKCPLFVHIITLVIMWPNRVCMLLFVVMDTASK